MFITPYARSHKHHNNSYLLTYLGLYFKICSWKHQAAVRSLAWQTHFGQADSCGIESRTLNVTSSACACQFIMSAVTWVPLRQAVGMFVQVQPFQGDPLCPVTFSKGSATCLHCDMQHGLAGNGMRAGTKYCVHYIIYWLWLRRVSTFIDAIFRELSSCSFFSTHPLFI
jgi:hypothetical protein